MQELQGKIIVEQTERYPIPAQIADSLNFQVQPVRRGDMLCFSAFTPHRSAPNRSPTRHRAVYYPTYAIPAPGRGSASRVYDDYYEYAWEWWRTMADKFPDDGLVPGKQRPLLHPTGCVPRGTGH